MLSRFFYILLINLLLGVHIRAQFSAPKYSNEFLAIGVGARGMAMGNTQIASVNDVTAAYWNPAGLTQIEDDYQLSLMHSEYFTGIAKYDYIGFATKVNDSSTLGLSLIRFGIDDIPDTRFLFDANGRLNYDNVRYFTAADYALLVSYAQSNLFVKGLNLGVNFKTIYRNVGVFANAWGFGLDAGLQYKVKNWNLGAVVRDVTGTFNAWSIQSDLLGDVYFDTGNDIPSNSIEVTIPRLLLGGSNVFTLNEKISLAPELGLDLTFDGKRNTIIKSGFVSIDPHIGLETNYKNILSLRLGMANVQQVLDNENNKVLNVQPNIGIGVSIRNLTFDYALTDIGDVSEALFSNVFSLKVKINRDE